MYKLVFSEIVFSQYSLSKLQQNKCLTKNSILFIYRYLCYFFKFFSKLYDRFKK